MTCAKEIAQDLRDARSYELVRLEVAMKYCHDCGLSIGETATFCATCGALVPSAPPCTLCGRDADDQACAPRVAMRSRCSSPGAPKSPP